jgi:molecular chaperone DnaK (HSP70)
MRAIGIDFGNTNSIVATAERGPPRALPNREGSL